MENTALRSIMDGLYSISDAGYIYIEPIDSLRNLITESRNKKREFSKHDLLCEKKDDFLKWFSKYIGKALGDKTYKDINLAEIVFSSELKNDHHRNEYIMKCLYLAGKYFEFLKSQISDNKISISSELVYDFLFEIEELVYWYEKYILHHQVKKRTSQSHEMTSYEIIKAAGKVFLSGGNPEISISYWGDIRPLVVFQIRQAIELCCREVIGLHSVQDNNGNEVKTISSSILEFIIKETTSTQHRISLPFDAGILRPIYNWAHNYVHKSFVDRSYLIYYALIITRQLFFIEDNTTYNDTDSMQELLEKLINSKRMRKVYNDKIKGIVGAVAELREYNSMKKDFEQYIIDLLDSKHGRYSFFWHHIDNVKAYIMSQ